MGFFESIKTKDEEIKRTKPTPKPTPTPRPSKPRPPRTQYRPVTEGDLFNLVKEALEGKIEMNLKTLDAMQRGYPRKPFGGKMKASGGWNSITYALFEVIEKSGKFYIKK